jgi:hypothetical protein
MVMLAYGCATQLVTKVLTTNIVVSVQPEQEHPTDRRDRQNEDLGMPAEPAARFGDDQAAHGQA